MQVKNLHQDAITVILSCLILRYLWIQHNFVFPKRERVLVGLVRNSSAAVNWNGSQQESMADMLMPSQEDAGGLDVTPVLRRALNQIPDPIFVVYGNRGYRAILGNFVCNMALFPGMHDHILAVVADNDTAKYLTSLSSSITVVVSHGEWHDEYAFETPAYLRLMIARGILLTEILRLAHEEASKTIVWLEPDFYYTQNLLSRPEMMETTSDLVFYWDQVMFCGCFIRFSPVAASYLFYKEVMERMQRIHNEEGGTTNDQDILNHVVAAQLPNYTLFDRCLYRSGTFSKDGYMLEYQQACRGIQPVAQHHNWVVGADSKIQRAKESRSWFLTEESEGFTCKQRDLLLVVMTMNRPKSLERLINSVSTARYSEDMSVDLRVTVDRSFSGEVHGPTMQFLNGMQWPHGVLEILVWPRKVGIYGQWVHSWPAEKYSSSLYKAVVLLEDDLEVSPYYARWFIGAHAAYGSVPGVGAVTGQRPNLVAAVNGPPSVEGQVPEGVKAFGYLLMATWSFSPKHSVWKEFREWVGEKRAEAGFEPVVPGIVPTIWYEHFKTRGEEEDMWEIWFLRFADEKKLHTVYPWVDGGRHTMVGNWMEAGLHFSGTPLLDFPIAGEQQDWDDGFLMQMPLPLVGYDLRFESPLAVLKHNTFITYSPDLLAVMGNNQCISPQCKLILKYHADPVALYDSLSDYGAKEDNNVAWRESDVLYREHGLVGPEGDVTLCNGTDMVTEVIGSFGCKLSSPSIEDFSSCPTETYSSPVHDKVIVISQMWGGGYFHALIEGLPRLMAAFHYLGEESGKSEWVVHSMISEGMGRVLGEFMGVKSFVGGSIVARRLLVPKPTPCGGSVKGVNTVRLRDFVVSQLELPDKPKRTGVLVVIKRLGSRSLTNHDEILGLCRELWLGPDVVEHTGQEAFVEQLALFHSASMVIGPHGAGFSNAIAMKRGSIILEVLPERGSNRLNVCYTMLAFTLELRYFALGAPGFDSDGAGTVDLTVLRQHPVWNQQTGGGLNDKRPVDLLGCNMSELMLGADFRHLVQWKSGGGDSVEVSVGNCRLDLIDVEFARRIVKESRGIGLIGDSLSRYQYLNLVYFLETGSWSSDPALPNEAENRFSNWNEFYAVTNQRMGGHEVCDCFRDNRAITVENRYFDHDGMQVKYFQMFGVDARILVHDPDLVRHGLCRPGSCSENVLPVHDLGLPLQSGAIHGLLDNNKDCGHVFFNGGIWWLVDSENTLALNHSSLIKQEVGKYRGRNHGGKLHWKMTTATKLQNRPEYLFARDLLRLGLIDSFFDSWALTVDILESYPGLIWDNYHFYWQVYKGLNTVLLAYLACFL